MSERYPVYAVILAGGCGTRFWPLSRRARPKQLLSLTDGESLLQATIARVLPLVGPRRVLVVTGGHLRDAVVRQASALRVPAENVFAEPEGRNTAPAICWAATIVRRRDPEGILVVLPSDHLVRRPAAFLRRIRQAVRRAAEGHLVTLGIVPTRPETGYGYLKVRPSGGRAPLRVERFTEKPDLPTARRFLRSGSYLWNSGMFVWRADVILEAFDRHQPAIAGAFASGDRVERFWGRLPSISVDYAILEKTPSVAIPAGDIGWTDLGSWEAAAEVLPRDRRGNTAPPGTRLLDCEGTLVVREDTGGKTIALLGVRDLVVVETPDALLVCRKDRSQDVRRIVELLKKEGRRCV